MKVRYLNLCGWFSTAYTGEDYRDDEVFYVGTDRYTEEPLVLTWDDEREAFVQIITPYTESESSWIL